MIHGKSNATLAKSPTPRRTAAVVFFGALPRWNSLQVVSSHRLSSISMDELCKLERGSLQSLEDHVLPLLFRYVVQPALSMQAFDAVHVYGHAWALSTTCSATSHLTKVLQEGLGRVRNVHIRSVLTTPLPTSISADDNLTHAHTEPSWTRISDDLLLRYPYMHALVSMKWALALLSGAASDDHIAAYGNTSSSSMDVPRWWQMPLSSAAPNILDQRGEAKAVLLLRWDAIFFTPFQWAELDWSMLYRANMCNVNPAAMRAKDSCAPLLPFYDPKTCPWGDVPDYYFASNTTVMQLVFANALEDYAKRMYTKKKCGVLHGILAGRIAYAAAKHGLPLGRYKYHHLDSTIYREPLLDARIRSWYHAVGVAEREAQQSIWEASDYAYDVRKHQDCSVCLSGPRYCGCPAHLLAVARQGQFPYNVTFPWTTQCTLLPWRHLWRKENPLQVTFIAGSANSACARNASLADPSL